MRKIVQVILHHLWMDYKYPFVTVHGKVAKKDFYIVEVIDQDGVRGYGETEAFPTPWYTEETTATTKIALENYLIPTLFQANIQHPEELNEQFQTIRRNHMAKAALEQAVWDLYAKKQQQPLYQLIGGTQETVPVGVSIGLKETDQALLDTIEEKIAAGYKRVKLKVRKGEEIDTLEKVRKVYPTLPLMIDANGSYSWKDKDRLLALDQFKLLMIEQPFPQNDFVDHAILQSMLETPLCLDESIHTVSDMKTAIALGSCQIVNVKLSRVGGFSAVKQIHDLAVAHDIPLWCGGMLEAGVGRAHSLAIATLPQFSLPADTASSSHYWHRDIIQPEVTLERGMIQLPQEPGLGYAVDHEALAFYRVDKHLYKNE